MHGPFGSQETALNCMDNHILPGYFQFCNSNASGNYNKSISLFGLIHNINWLAIARIITKNHSSFSLELPLTLLTHLFTVSKKMD